MPSALPASSQRQAETTVTIYMPRSLREELEARVAASDDENFSRIVRQAIREHFKRHPLKRSAT